jgi:hypothetical protein
MLFIFSTSVVIRHLVQLKTVVFQHWYPLRAVLLSPILVCTIICGTRHLCQLSLKQMVDFSIRLVHLLDATTYPIIIPYKIALISLDWIS